MTYAIPTKWNGVQFRSRLEARWAAFFTAIGWEWSYEPIDLQGYIPDFLLHLHEDVLVEVKPFTRFGDPVIAEAREKIRASGWGGASGVVGSRMTGFWIGPDLVCDGLCHSCFHWNEREKWRQVPSKTVFRLASDSSRSECLVCGNTFTDAPDDGDFEFCDYGEDPLTAIHTLLAAWNEAGNAVQWRRRA